MQCLLDDAGLSLGLVSLPFQQEGEFFDQEIKPIFARYTQSVKSHFRDGSADPSLNEFGSLYDPIPFYLFGRFDLAVLYLVDDHDFSCRTLRPFHPTASGGAKRYLESFDYKVVFGPTPRFSPATSNPEGIIDLVTQARARPLIAVTLIKVSNSLLLGGGATLLRLIVNFIKDAATDLEADKDTRLIILESYAWHEITLVMLGSSYTRLLDFVAKLRDASYGDLVKVSRDRAAARSGTELADIDDQLRGMRHLVGPDLRWSPRDVERAPLFGSLTTNIGFNFEIFSNRTLLDAIDPTDRIHLLSRWFVKPGRLAEFSDLALPAGDSLICSVGRGDLWYGLAAIAPDVAQTQPPVTRQAIESYLDQNGVKGLNNAALQRYTLAAVAMARPIVTERGKRFSDRLRKMIFSNQELREIDSALRRLRVPKVLIHRLSNVYTNFNDGALDRTLYASFAELRPFLERVASELKAEARLGNASLSHSDLCRRIQKWSSNFERAYRNRFHNSEQMGEVTDFNFEFKGGIQQVVTAFDAAYKALSSVLGSPGTFVSVGADPGVDSTEYEVRLNYFHIFQPEMFFAVAGKEASNWFADTHEGALDDWVLQWIKSNLNPAHDERRQQWLAEVVDRALRYRKLDPQIRELARSWFPVAFLQSHFAELLTSQVCYAGNWDLFSYWTLGCFLQIAGAYDRNGRLDDIEIARFLLRARMIAGPDREDTFAESIEAFGDRDIIDVYKSLAFRGQLEALRDALMRDRVLGKWFGDARQASETIARIALSEGRPQGSLKDIQRRARDEAGRKRNEIADGHVPRFQPTDGFSAFRFCQHVLYGYLLLLKESWSGKPPRLKRARDGAPKAEAGSSKLLFDPLGGVFAHEAQARRQLFKYRSAVTMSMWDLGLKAKRDAIAERMQEHK